MPKAKSRWKTLTSRSTKPPSLSTRATKFTCRFTKPIRIEEFDAEKAWWGTEADGFAARVENERAWKVSIEQIKAANYNLDQKNPHAAEVVSHDPDELLADYARLQTEVQGLRDQLKSILAQSLGAKA